MDRTVYVLGTRDTKGAELDYLATCLERAGARAVTVDVGTGGPPAGSADIEREAVAACHPEGSAAVFHHRDRGAAVTAMAQALEIFLVGEARAGRVSGVIGLGGTGGSALLSPAFRALPIGFPKVLVSTVASGQTAPYVGTSDFTLVHSVVDVAGLNGVSRRILANAARALAGMVAEEAPAVATKPTVGMTMFGVTTPCVTAVREVLERDGWDCLVFHATGTGGQAMEKLADSGFIEALLDLTTTEVADEVVGGVFRAGAERFDLLARRELPCVLSLGALDMVNFGAPETIPAAFRDRKFHVHNSNVTLMRTTPEENREFARWMAPKLNRAIGPLTLLIPEKGISALDAPGQPFFDPEADEALFTELEKLIELSPHRTLQRVPHHVNDPAFAEAALREFRRLTSPLTL